MVVVDLQWRAELMALSRSRIEAQRDLVELGLAVDRQVGALGQVLAQQAVGVLVAAALPRAVRVGEVHLHTGTPSVTIVVRSTEPPPEGATGATP